MQYRYKDGSTNKGDLASQEIRTPQQGLAPRDGLAPREGAHQEELPHHGRPIRYLLADDRGAALIITLFIVALVTILVLEYHFDSSVELELADNYASEVQAHYLAMTGLNFARIVLQRDNAAYDAPDEPWSLLSALTSTTCIAPQQLLEWAKSLAQAQENKASSSGESTSGTTGSTSGTIGSTSGTTLADRFQLQTSETMQENAPACVRLSIVDEARKLPINALVDQGSDTIDPVWQQIFESFFASFEIEQPEAVVNALVDWIDKSDGYLEGGGEDEYYEGLTPPYTTPDRPMQVPGELRLVRYFDCEMLAKLFPGKECKDMADIDLGTNEYLTPFGGSGTTVNLNTASEAVLNALTQNNTPCVSSILEKRIIVAGQLLSEPMKDLSQIDQSCNAAGDFAQVADIKSDYFRVESQGEVNGHIRKKIVAVLQRGGQQALPTVVYFKVE